MAIDNDIYNREAGTWRDEDHVLSLLTSFTPPRVDYIRRVLADKAKLDPPGKKVLDIGCGGGLMAEEVARLGCSVTGVDPSAPSIETARLHAASLALDIDYRVGAAEALPFEDASFDVGYCCDVLEHVGGLEAAIAEVARVLKPGGIYIYDTVNRTLLSKLIVIKLAQEWQATSIFPPNFHRWSMFIKPEELVQALSRHGLENREVTGIAWHGNPLTLLRLIRLQKRGRINYGVVGRYLSEKLELGRNTQLSYLGYAVRRV